MRQLRYLAAEQVSAVLLLMKQAHACGWRAGWWVEVKP